MTVLITGAAGNLGGKLSRHLCTRYALRRLDLDSHGDAEIQQADFSVWQRDWVREFRGVDTVVHLAANPKPADPWERLIEPNIDATINVFAAAAQANVKRVVFASSNHVMGGYKNFTNPRPLTTDLPVHPGTPLTRRAGRRDSARYATTKLFGERLGRHYAERHDMSVIAVRLGYVQDGENRAADISPVDRWLRSMWLSNRDFCQLMTCCIEAAPTIRFAILNGMSANTGMRWDIDHARDLVSYAPLDDAAQSAGNIASFSLKQLVRFPWRLLRFVVTQIRPTTSHR